MYIKENNHLPTYCLKPNHILLLEDYLIMKYFLCILLFFPGVTLAKPSTCYGSTSNGRLENGVKLPASGENYKGYSSIARLAGRTYVHSAVKNIITASYKDLEKEQPNKVYKYAETGFEDGGQFRPHKTHRNGLSVDFMTPVVDKSGKSVHLPTNPLNKFGYNIEFNKKDKFKDLSIDYEHCDT